MFKQIATALFGAVAFAVVPVCHAQGSDAAHKMGSTDGITAQFPKKFSK